MEILSQRESSCWIAFVTRDSVCHQIRDPKVCGTHKDLRMVQVPYSTDAVKTALGNITIVGKTMPVFGARIKVTAAPAGTPPTNGTVNGTALEGVITPVKRPPHSLRTDPRRRRCHPRRSPPAHGCRPINAKPGTDSSSQSASALADLIAKHRSCHAYCQAMRGLSVVAPFKKSHSPR